METITSVATGLPWLAASAGKTALTNYFFELSKLYEVQPRIFYGECFVLLLLVYFVGFKRSYDPKKKGYGARPPAAIPTKVRDELIDEWTPQPLVNIDLPADREQENFGHERVLRGKPGIEVQLVDRDEKLLNFASFDFLNLNDRDEIRKSAEDCLEEFGCGSCGPRGFYGTSDVHLDLENRIAKFLETNDAVMYSDAATTPASVIPAFCKKGDVIVADDGVSESNLTGLELSRSKVFFFKHNDMDDCERQMQNADKFLRRQAKHLSKLKFLVIEGLYRDYGDVPPLKKIKFLKEKYHFRVAIDDSFGIGTLGKTGRGAIEEQGLKLNDFEMLSGSLSSSLASIGGFSVGYVPDVVDHQRLNGAGYVFSASSPMFTCAAAITALDLLENEGPRLLAELKKRAAFAHSAANNLEGLTNVSDPISPILHLRVADATGLSRLEVEHFLQTVVDVAENQGALFCRSRYVPVGKGSIRPSQPPPSIRVTVSAGHTEEQIARGFKILQNAVNTVKRQVSVACSCAGRIKGLQLTSASNSSILNLVLSNNDELTPYEVTKTTARAVDLCKHKLLLDIRCTVSENFRTTLVPARIQVRLNANATEAQIENDFELLQEAVAH